jgi:16S rRNA (adenine1518-N6/adenine1519-N6)-dimethyltransferase
MRKRFGQHFLERAWADRVVDAIAPATGDVVVEIGPGRGALTLSLAERVSTVVAIEIDRDLASALAGRAPSNVRVVSADVLDVDVPALLEGRRFRLAGNLPYNVSSPILFRMLRWQRERQCLIDATLMLQREVADRIAAGPGSRDYGVLSILTQLQADVTRLFTLPPGAFRPPPKVHSAVLRLQFRPPRVALADYGTFEAMVRTLFTQRRKTVQNALKPYADARGASASGCLASAGIDPRRRPETLDLSEFARLAALFQ